MGKKTNAQNKSKVEQFNYINDSTAHPFFKMSTTKLRYMLI